MMMIISNDDACMIVYTMITRCVTRMIMPARPQMPAAPVPANADLVTRVLIDYMCDYR